MNAMRVEHSRSADVRNIWPLRTCVVAAEEIKRQRLSNILASAGLTVMAPGPRVESVVLALDDLEGSELEQLATVRAQLPDARFVVVTAAASRRSLNDALEAGADGFVLENRAVEGLAAVVRAVCAGNVVLPLEWRNRVSKPVLSSREKQALAMVVMGFTNREIANRLLVAESTVKSHLTSIYAKLGVRGRNEATALVVDSDNGLGAGIVAIHGRTAAIGKPSARLQVAKGGISLTSKANLSGHVVYRAFAHETVVLNLDTGLYESLDPESARMLNALECEETVGAALGRLSGEHAGATAAHIERDLLLFCEDLLECGFLELDSSGRS
jgi:DNA-binding NarL/FixJ family response regulator